MNINRDANLQFHQAALSVRAQRQEVLASNIANADTPHYKARDLDFRAALQGAMGARVGKPVALATTSGRHLGGHTAMASPYALYRQEDQSSVDGNTVNMDTERAAFAENAMYYEASVSFVNGLLRSMQTAISGQ